MKRIWSPWRVQYVHNPRPQGCIFCDKPPQGQDRENRILLRGRLNFIIMNAFPYNPGHLMVAPFRHIAILEDMSMQERNEHIKLVSQAVGVLRSVAQTGNFNVGMNLGPVAGAAVADHVHTHIVPRWNGDNNFMPVIAETRVISESMEDIYQRLKEKF